MSISTQKTMLKDYAKRNGFLNCQFYVDDGYSGTNYDRHAKLYEDLTRELITEKRFQMLSARYDSEQEELTAKIKELEKSAIVDKEQLSSIEHFADIQNKKECGGNRQWQRRFLRNWAADTSGKAII